jgi:EPS-associated MarR family transcriptional regulator
VFSIELLNRGPFFRPRREWSIPSIQEFIHYQLLKYIQDNPQITQRELAQKTGVSLGKINYCLRALIDKGLLKATDFKNSRNRKAYAYKLTPGGIREKLRLTSRYLKLKLKEYEALKAEIEELMEEAQSCPPEDEQ